MHSNIISCVAGATFGSRNILINVGSPSSSDDKLTIPTQERIIITSAFFAAFHFADKSCGFVSKSVKGAIYIKYTSFIPIKRWRSQEEEEEEDEKEEEKEEKAS